MLNILNWCDEFVAFAKLPVWKATKKKYEIDPPDDVDDGNFHGISSLVLCFKLGLASPSFWRDSKSLVYFLKSCWNGFFVGLWMYWGSCFRDVIESGTFVQRLSAPMDDKALVLGHSWGSYYPETSFYFFWALFQVTVFFKRKAVVEPRSNRTCLGRLSENVLEL